MYGLTHITASSTLERLLSKQYKRSMFSAAPIALSTPFLGAKSAVGAPSQPPPPPFVRFLSSARVSAAYTTTERRKTSAGVSYSHFATAASLYEVLGIQMGATCQEIKTAYRRLARVTHPDVASNGEKHTSADEFIRIQAAYSTLSDPRKRADYDRSLFRRRRPVSSTPFSTSPSGFSGGMRRNWETDQCW